MREIVTLQIGGAGNAIGDSVGSYYITTNALNL